MPNLTPQETRDALFASSPGGNLAIARTRSLAALDAALSAYTAAQALDAADAAALISAEVARIAKYEANFFECDALARYRLQLLGQDPGPALLLEEHIDVDPTKNRPGGLPTLRARATTAIELRTPSWREELIEALDDVNRAAKPLPQPVTHVHGLILGNLNRAATQATELLAILALVEVA